MVQTLRSNKATLCWRSLGRVDSIALMLSDKKKSVTGWHTFVTTA